MDKEATDGGSQCRNCGDKIEGDNTIDNSLSDYVSLDILCVKCLLVLFGQNISYIEHCQTTSSNTQSIIVCSSH